MWSTQADLRLELLLPSEPFFLPSSLPFLSFPSSFAFVFLLFGFSWRGQVSICKGEEKRVSFISPSLPSFSSFSFPCLRFFCGCVFVVTLPFVPSYPHRTTSLLPVRNCPRGVGNRGARGTAGVGVRGELRGRACKLQIACLEGKGRGF